MRARLILPFVMLVFGALTGCDIGPHREKSKVMSEPAMVRDLIYQPARHGSGSGVGMSMRGSVVITSDTVHLPSNYAIVFECKHGKFIIEGTQQKYKALWQKLRVGQAVNVTYREVWRIKADGTRDFVKFEFMDAT